MSALFVLGVVAVAVETTKKNQTQAQTYIANTTRVVSLFDVLCCVLFVCLSCLVAVCVFVVCVCVVIVLLLLWMILLLGIQKH